MNTEQNYAPDNSAANPVVPTAQQNPSAVNSDPQAEVPVYKAPATVSIPRHLSDPVPKPVIRIKLEPSTYDLTHSSEAEVLLFALMAQRDRYLSEMMQMIGAEEFPTAYTAYQDFCTTCSLIDEFALNAFTTATNNYWAAEHQNNPHRWTQQLESTDKGHAKSFADWKSTFNPKPQA